MHKLQDKKVLFELLDQGAMVITPNNRLSATLLERYFGYKNKSTLRKPTCAPYGTIISSAYNQLKSATPHNKHPVLLNDSQCQYLWKKIIREDSSITYTLGLLKAVMQAYEYCQLWGVSPENSSFIYTFQTQIFQKWWHIFEWSCEKNHVITEHQLIPYLINANHEWLHQTVVWACFDSYTPQQMAFQHYLTKNNVAQYHYDLQEHDGLPQRLAAKDSKEEYEQLIAWLKLKLTQPVARIGVVVPNLQSEGPVLQRMIEQHFDTRLFNISLGHPLADFPIIAHAIVWLKLDPMQVSHHQVSLLLQSPYLGYAKEEFVARSRYLQDSRFIQKDFCTVRALHQDIEPIAPKLSCLLKNLIPYPEKASIIEWIELFQDRLNQLGFPGDYGINSLNYQCITRFNGVFDEFRQLSLLSSSLTTTEALEALVHIVQHTVFQAQKTNTIIEIQGLLEASGCEFDCLWVMGLTNQCLPQKNHLSAFIPHFLQRQLNMPHSSPERELQYAKQILQRLENSSPETIFSYPRFQEDTPTQPCTLIEHFPDFIPLVTNDTIQNPIALVPMEEPYLVALRSNESSLGGVALLANQAKCPFKAFAEHRLKAQPLLMKNEGMDNNEKGQLIHKVMELFWRNISSQKHLLGLSDDALNQQIETAIHEACERFISKDADSFAALLRDIEYIRLKRLVLASLEWEKKRPPFVVSALEQVYSINVAGLDFTLRVDRLDTVADKKWVIDYKSTLPSTKPWNEARPREPQLLVYALLDDTINALILLQLKTGKLMCSGLSEEPWDIDGISALKKDESWSEYKNNWREQLHILAQEFQDGDCIPKPLNAAICQLCNFQNLCRFQNNTRGM